MGTLSSFSAFIPARTKGKGEGSESYAMSPFARRRPQA
jgi:hypothetical protein